MRVTRALHASLVAIGITSLLSHGLRAQQAADMVVRVGDNDLGGTITSTNGPEAGVWVIAETTELPTKLAKIAVTDDRGQQAADVVVRVGDNDLVGTITSTNGPEAGGGAIAGTAVLTTK